MNEIIEDIINIEEMIYEINGNEVMLDSDLARLYGVETKRVNEAVYRNKEYLGLQMIMSLIICGRKMRPQILAQNLELILEYLQNKEFTCLQQF